MNRKTLAAVAALTVALSACANENNAASTEQDIARTQLDGFLKAQPVPTFAFSQLRQNLIEIEAAQAGTTATTSFFFNQGIANPISSCPSIGFPIPSTYQLTNPMQVADTSRDNGVTIGQMESTGVYTGDSSGTYVICVDGEGAPYAMYWEGFVSTVSGPAQWVDGQVVLTGKPSVDFTVKRP